MPGDSHCTSKPCSLVLLTIAATAHLCGGIDAQHGTSKDLKSAEVSSGHSSLENGTNNRFTLDSMGNSWHADDRHIPPGGASDISSRRFTRRVVDDRTEDRVALLERGATAVALSAATEKSSGNKLLRSERMNTTRSLELSQNEGPPREHGETSPKNNLDKDFKIVQDGGTASIGLMSFLLTARGKDCPDSSFPIKDRLSCKAAMDNVNARGSEILLLPAVEAITDDESVDDRPGGCYLHCEKPTQCEVRFNDALGKVNSRLDRRYCKSYFSFTRGKCRHSSTRVRHILSRGTFKDLDECMNECLRGPLHSHWCDSFEIQDPFTNECYFFMDGYKGDSSRDGFCYTRVPSGH